MQSEGVCWDRGPRRRDWVRYRCRVWRVKRGKAGVDRIVCSSVASKGIGPWSAQNGVYLNSKGHLNGR